VDINRVVDNPPVSRNEKLAALMRQLKMCEEAGSGWDKIVLSSELMFLPAPTIAVFDESTRVSLFAIISFKNLEPNSKLWSCYMHACIKYIQQEQLTNASLRQRFDLPESSSGMISRLIKEAVKKQLIRPFDPSTAPRYMKYVPIWA
jgi:predicted HTH transcriptional regulator